MEKAVNLDIVMPMYNSLEYSHNYSMTSGSLWNYYIDEVNDDENEHDNANNRINNNKTITSKSFLVEPGNLVFLKTYNTEFIEIIIIFADR